MSDKTAHSTLTHDFAQIIERRNSGSLKWSRYPDNVLPMWVADSDFKAPQPVLDALARQVEHGVFGYPDSLGDSLAVGAQTWMGERFGWRIEKEWVTYAAGVCSGLALCINACTKPGEGVFIQTPIYPPFISLPKLNGRRTLASSLLAENGAYVINWADFQDKIRQAKLFMLCNPHNPSGRVFTRQELERMAELCLKYQVTVVADEVHCDFVAPGRKHVPFASLAPEVARITLTIISPSKTFNVAGLHTAAIFSANPDLLGLVRAEGARYSLSADLTGLEAFRVAYTECAYYADQQNLYIRGNVEYAVNFIQKRIPKIRAYLPEGTYLLWLDCRQLGLNQAELMDFFQHEAGLGLNSGADYGSEGLGFVRLNLACPRTTLDEALARLKKACLAFFG